MFDVSQSNTFDYEHDLTSGRVQAFLTCFTIVMLILINLIILAMDIYSFL